MSSEKSTFAQLPRSRAGRSSLRTLIALTLPASIGLFSPPSLAADAAGGAGTAADAPVGAAAWTNLLSVPVIAAAPRYCTATCSADFRNPLVFGAPNVYRFTLTLNNLNPAFDGTCERMLGFNNIPANGLIPDAAIRDNIMKEVTSTCFFRVPPGTHRIRCLARKTGGADTMVTDASMTANCLDTPLP